MSGFGRIRRFGLVISIGSASTACDGCRRDHPFTPFVVSSAGTSTGVNPGASAEVARPPDAGKPEVHLAQGEKLPPNSRSFALGTRQAEAPASATVDSVLRADWNSDGNVDAIALMRANPGEPGPVGAVYFYQGGGDARRLIDIPGWVPSGSDCNWETHLSQLGAHTASVDLRVQCGAAMPPRTPTRFLGVLAPSRTQPLVIGWRLADPAPGETFAASAKLDDRDGDGAEDTVLTTSLGLAPGGDTAQADLVWLDRTAGPSRASGQLLASLEPLLASLEKKASAGKTAQAASAGAGLVWRLLGSTCAESGTPRLFNLDGAPIGCDSLNNIVSRLAAIEVRAALTQNDVLHAAFVASRARGAFGTSQPNQDYTRLVKTIRKACTLPEALSLTNTEVRPVTVRPGPHFSPLQFQADGLLMAMTAKGVIRLQNDGHESEDADAATPAPWPLAVTSPDGRTWEMLAPSCDRSEIAVVSKAQTGALLAPDVTNLLAPRPGLCAGRPSLNWHVNPIRFEEGKPPLAIVEGACISADPSTSCLKALQLGRPQPGSALSPNGRYLTVATGVGLFVVGGPRPELWEHQDLGNLDALTDCVVSNGGDRVACVRSGRVVLLSKARAPENGTPSKAAN